jgi:C4-dicarboxylate-specific signal transduction histidine kinase
MKRVALLLRHELVGSGCKLEIKNSISQDVILQGDINSMVQVVNNLVTNAVDAEKGMGGGVISILLEKTGEEFLIKVKDTGAGVPEDVKKKLFKQMITSKGAMGNGLGIYISNSVIKAKFNGRMWMEDNPEGGAIFGIAIPLQYVSFAEFQKRGDAE